MTSARGTGRMAILDAAMRLFRQKGFAATSVDDLCAVAGVTKGAFSCVAGTLAQETHATHPAIRDAAGVAVRGMSRPTWPRRWTTLAWCAALDHAERYLRQPFAR